MSFFGKLKAKLFRSSSKLDTDISNLVTDDNNQEREDKGFEEINQSNDVLQVNEKDNIISGHNSSEKKENVSKKAKKNSFFKKIIQPVAKLVKKRKIDSELLESLEDILISADLGINASSKVSSLLSKKYSGLEVGSDEIKELLSDVIEEILDPVAKPLVLSEISPQVLLIVGVNGSGKTTTIGKLASKYVNLGKSVMIAACDTYRAAAVEQLSISGERAGVPVIKGADGSDPASLAFEAYERAIKEGTNILLIDTAGRLQNRTDLMSELDKIIRVLNKKDPASPQNRVLVLDATTGQNAINQVSEFLKVCEINGIIMTKLDGTAKGGVLVAIAEKFGLPVHFIGIGESIDDLQPFEPKDFAYAITGISDGTKKT